MLSVPCWIRPLFRDHPSTRVFWVLLFDCVAEGNGRLVEVEREYWEAISGGIMKAPPNVREGNERRVMRKRITG